MEIKVFEYSDNGLNEVKSDSKGKNWPVVYLIHNDNALYIGETTSAAVRMDQHLKNPEKQKENLKTIEIIFDDTFNKSVILDYEQKLIKYCKTDKNYENIINKNAGQSSTHDYYDRDHYNNYFRCIWAELIKHGVAKNSIDIIENQNIFKYSPYNALTEEQNEISVDIIKDITQKLQNKEKGISLVDGCAGTGKTVLAISMINSLVNAINIDEDDLTEEDKSTDKVKALLELKRYIQLHQDLTIGFVFPMTGIRKTISTVFKECGNGLSVDMVLSPYDVRKKKYDVLFVDESHRLCKRKNIMNFSTFDETCAALGMDKYTSNQLDWVLEQAQYTVLFYDKDQSIKGSDISYNEFQNSLYAPNIPVTNYFLTTQMRCQGGDSYIKYIKEIINVKNPSFKNVDNYDFKIFDDVDVMVNKIKELNKQYELCRNVAGYSWKWVTKPSKKNKFKTYEDIKLSGSYDIDINGNHYVWNVTTEDWISREDSIDTIGCIHTTQGFDLNYVGVIFGEEIDYNPVTNRIEVDLSKFYDKNVKNGTDEDTVKDYIINTYTTIMARGIRGCYVYACNDNLQNYLKQFIKEGE